MNQSLLAQNILQQVVRKPFRKTAVDGVTAADTLQKINQAIEQNKPLCFSLPFGGYKADWMPFSPQLNWAEVFWLDYLRQLFLPVAELYPPGVELSFSYMSGVLHYINGIPDLEQAVYLSQFQHLLLQVSEPGICFQLKDLADEYGGSEGALIAVQQQEQLLLHRSDYKVSAERWASAERNLRNSNEVLTGEAFNLSSAAQQSKARVGNAALIQSAAMRCEAMENLELRRKFNKFGCRIQLSHVKGGSLSLHIGSCPTSVLQPWVGMGIVEQGKPRIAGRAVLQHQFRYAAAETAPVSELLLNAAAQNPSAALRQIPVLL